ncbi:hypothetical protein STRNTR1_3851 [Stenotrophomonas maltophilia]|nr:hypothetical protein STRNTR1_3851 [Stenotrophomonas maltophilia]
MVWPPARGAAGTSSSRGTVANCGPCGGLAGWDHPVRAPHNAPV